MKTVAVIQPYFLPYLGYFSLFARADEVILLDCVQFPRRGRVHRCNLPAQNAAKWLTLPLTKAPRDTKIKDIEFAPNATATWESRLQTAQRSHPTAHINDPVLSQVLPIKTTSLAAYLEGQIAKICEYLDLNVMLRRSSDLSIDPSLKAQERIIAIAKASDATSYINPPGGRGLYCPETFAQNGLSLHFLPPYTGAMRHLFLALSTEPKADLQKDLRLYSSRPYQVAA